MAEGNNDLEASGVELKNGVGLDDSTKSTAVVYDGVVPGVRRVPVQPQPRTKIPHEQYQGLTGTEDEAKKRFFACVDAMAGRWPRQKIMLKENHERVKYDLQECRAQGGPWWPSSSGIAC